MVFIMEKVEERSSVDGGTGAAGAETSQTENHKTTIAPAEEKGVTAKDQEKKTDLSDTTNLSITRAKSLSSSANWEGDYQVLRKLGTDYQQMIEVKQLEILSSFKSAKQTAWASIAYLVVLFTCGTTIVKVKADIPLSQAILFSVYTFTSAGFGNVKIPHTTSFLLFVIFYVYTSITALAILVAQTFQYLELQTTRWGHSLAKAKYAADGEAKLATLIGRDPLTSAVDRRIRNGLLEALKVGPKPHFFASGDDKKSVYSLVLGDPCSAIPSIIKAILFMACLLLIGAIVMMNLEGWTFVEGLYFATFAMTTVGYGDLTPTKSSSTWFVNFWLPFNVAFLAVYLSTVAHYYVRFANWNVARIERQLQLRKQQRDRKNKSPTPPTSVSTTDNNSIKRTPNPCDQEKGQGVSMSSMAVDVEQGLTSSSPKNKAYRPNKTSLTPGVRRDANATKTTTTTEIAKTDGVLLEDGSNDSRAATTTVLEEHADSNKRMQESKMLASSSVDGSGLSPLLDDRCDSSLSKKPSKRLEIPELLTIFNEGQYTSSVRHDGLRRRERICQSSRWEIRDFFSKNPEQQESTEPDNQLECAGQIETILDLLNHLSLTKTTGAGLLAGREQQDEDESVPGLQDLKIRLKVLEFLARIVAFEANNVESEVEIDGDILSVTMNRLNDASEHWLIPNRAREAFRSVFFSSLIYVGEQDIFKRGVDAFFNLNPLQFQSVFGQFVIAIQDTEKMLAWLVKTQSLRDQLLETTSTQTTSRNAKENAKTVSPIQAATLVEKRRNRRTLKNRIEAYFPPNPGNAVRIQM